MTEQRFSRLWKVAGLVAASGMIAATMAMAQAPAPADLPAHEATTLDGVFTAAQADRGVTTFTERGCVGCHGADFNGTPGGPGLIGGRFRLNWNNKLLSDLFDWVKANMPPGQAGSLTDVEYTDIIAALLRVNSMPASETVELDPATLNTILYQRVPPAQ